MPDEEPRYEFRVWADTLADVRNKLHLLATTVRKQTSEETYLISAATDKCNAKIRDKRLNIKILSATAERLELWKPVLDAEFPLDRSLIADQILPSLELDADIHSPRYSMDEFLNKLIRPRPKIAIVAAVKRRTQLRLQECLAEFTTVSIGRAAYETVAVESAQAAPVLRVIHQLQIESMPNRSYIAQLKQLLGEGVNARSAAERQEPST